MNWSNCRAYLLNLYAVLPSSSPKKWQSIKKKLSWTEVVGSLSFTKKMWPSCLPLSLCQKPTLFTWAISDIIQKWQPTPAWERKCCLKWHWLTWLGGCPQRKPERWLMTHTKGGNAPPPPPRLCLQQLHQETPLSGKEEEEVKKAVKLTHNLGKPTLTRKQKEKGWPFKSLIVGLAEETEIDTNS